MTKTEKAKLWASYESGLRLACSYYVTNDYSRASDIVHSISLFMVGIDDFEMYGTKKQRKILSDYGIDFSEFVYYMSGGKA